MCRALNFYSNFNRKEEFCCVFKTKEDDFNKYNMTSLIFNMTLSFVLFDEEITSSVVESIVDESDF